MKKIAPLTFVLFLICTIGFAQDTMYVHKTGGLIDKYPVNTIDSITFYHDTVATLSVGENYLCGVIAYILQPGDIGYDPFVQHGFITAPAVLSTSKKWSSSTGLTLAVGTAIGTGQENTDSIVANYGVGTYAAYGCSSYISSSCSDWYLPSIDELNKMYLNRVAIGGFSTLLFWSSSEDTSANAFLINFATGGISSYDKTVAWKVRPIRSF